MNAGLLKNSYLSQTMTKMRVAPDAARIHRVWWQVQNWPYWRAAFVMRMKPMSAAHTNPKNRRTAQDVDVVPVGGRKSIRALYIARMVRKVFPKRDPG